MNTLLAIARSIPAKINQDIQWLVVGDGPLREALQNESPPNMSFTGYLKGDALAEVYSASDILFSHLLQKRLGMLYLRLLQAVHQ